MASDHDHAGIDRPRRVGNDRVFRPIPEASERAVAASIAAIAMLLLLASRVLLNSPLELGWLLTIGAPVEHTAIGLTGLAAVAVGLLADDWRVLVGLVTVGVFGLLTVLVPAAGLPAAGAVIAGGVVTVSASITTGNRSIVTRRAVVSIGVLGGGVLALGVGVGLLPAESRALGSSLFLLGLAATPLIVSPSAPGWASGGLVAAVTLLFAVAVPFITGAALLVAWAVVGASALVVALGFAGIATVAVTAIHRRDTATVAGAMLLFAAGVPATSGRAVAAVLGLALLVLPRTPGRDTL